MLPSATLQTHTVPSSPVLASQAPTGEIASEFSIFVWPVRVAVQVTRSQTRIAPSVVGAGAPGAVGEIATDIAEPMRLMWLVRAVRVAVQVTGCRVPDPYRWLVTDAGEPGADAP
ncbi:hypothetical protein GCM10010298_76200 [Streptomyces microflavus]|uniref:Uncharacterized protein n=1 Tax=Streptomyces microflavus TaxID=1919 RepID=A0A7J0D6S1_STRMI|nr:hypothetical protein Smic_84300 [Streptomyces microflavus]GGX99829.1 hypothetical protein GCM10010298_76200 [Streptomyces microflavus]